MKPQLTVKRYPYEEPHHLQLEFFVTNGGFSGNTDIYCNASDLNEIGRALRSFPKRIDDEYRYEYGSEGPDSYNYFLLRVYTFDSVGHSAVQFSINNNCTEPNEGRVRFSIRADVASVNRLGELFENFAKLEDYDFEWSPSLVD